LIFHKGTYLLPYAIEKFGPKKDLIPEGIWSRSEFDAEAIENLVPAGI
jgi:hypothetical protein